MNKLSLEIMKEELNERLKDGTTIIKNKILFNPNLNSNEKIVLIVLIMYNDEKKDLSYPTYQELKLATGINGSATISRILKSLEEKKYIKKESIQGKGNKYFIAEENIVW